MARYFFNFRQGDDYSVDPVGSEFPNAEGAYLEAYKTAEAMWSELLVSRRDPRRCSFEICDRDGNVLFLLPFREVLDSCHDRLDSPRASSFRETAARIEHFRRVHQDLLKELEKTRHTLRQSAALVAKT